MHKNYNIISNTIHRFIKRKYKIGKFEICVPPNHALPKYQFRFKLYDRFLPHLVKFLDSPGTIIDIGANIGDTTIAMLQNCKNPIISIEPSDYFYKYLEKNISSLDKTLIDRVSLFKNLIGTSELSGSLDHTKKGTASINLVNSNPNNNFVKLDELIDHSINISLLKVDTDGFDYDVLLSGKKTIEHSKPMIFWENEINNNLQFEGYKKLYAFLESIGYSYIYLFDNYGNILYEDNKFETLIHLNKYILSMSKFGCTRTFYYTDILAVHEKDITKTKLAIEEYRKQFIDKQ